MNPVPKPNKGDNARASKTLAAVSILTAAIPATATPAPKTPATNEWLTLIGKPKRVATRTHVTAEIMAAITAVCGIISGSTIPFPMVLATAVPVRAPSKFMDAPKRTPFKGLSTLVEIAVAIAFAASLMPLP